MAAETTKDGQAILKEAIDKITIDSLWDLYEYMAQFPDDFNAVCMYERIKQLQGEIDV